MCVSVYVCVSVWIVCVCVDCVCLCVCGVCVCGVCVCVYVKHCSLAGALCIMNFGSFHTLLA